MNSSFFDVDSGEVSRAGRVRKRSSKLNDYDSYDDAGVARYLSPSGSLSIKSQSTVSAGTGESPRKTDPLDAYSIQEDSVYQVVDAVSGDESFNDEYSIGAEAVIVDSNAEVRADESDEDDLSNLIMVANEEEVDDDGGEEEDDDVADEPEDQYEDQEDPDDASDDTNFESDQLVIDETATKRTGKTSRSSQGGGFKDESSDGGDDVKKGVVRSNLKGSQLWKQWNQQRSTRKDKGQSRISAYLLWARDVRDEVTQKHPDMDFSQINKRLGAMWNGLTETKKYNYKRRAQRLNNRAIDATPTGSSAKMKSTGRWAGNKSSSTSAEGSSGGHQTAGAGGDTAASGAAATSSGGTYRVTSTQPMDLAAHLLLLGESLEIIGRRLRDREGQIAVSGTLSVVLDSLMCALVPLLALTKHVPELDSCPEAQLVQMLDNVAYFMPGL